VVSALADGADQLVAEDALALGLPLLAILPMPRADYIATLADETGRQCFSTLWEKASLRLELPWAEGERDANWQYEQVGLTINRASHILLALWDGNDLLDGKAEGSKSWPEKRGGTAHILQLRLHGESDSRIPGASPIISTQVSRLDPPESGVTLWINTPRRSVPGNEAGAGTVREMIVAEDGTVREEPFSSDRGRLGAGQSIGRDLDRLDASNALLARTAQAHAAAVAVAAKQLLPAHALEVLRERAETAERLRSAYALSDVFAQINQRRIYRVLLGVVIALLIAVLAFEVFAHLDRSWRILSVYLLAIIGPALAYWLFIRRAEWQNRFQDFRALAEALRVQLFWGLGGVASFVSDHYLKKHRSGMTWIRQALRGLALQGSSLGLGEAHHALVREHWIHDQLAFFGDPHGGSTAKQGKAERDGKTYRRLDRAATVAYVAGVVIGLAVFCMLISGRSIDHLAFEIVVVAMGLAPAIAAALSIYAEKRAFHDHAHQYHRMGALFARAWTLLSGEMSDANRRAIILDLGVEALSENGDWLIAHRDRPVEPIRGG